MAPGGVGLPVRLAGYLRSSPITLTLRCFDRREFDTGNTRHRLDWEREALAAGMDPVEVDIRRDLEENIHDAAEEVMEAVDRVCELLRPHSRGCVDRGCEQSGQVFRVSKLSESTPGLLCCRRAPRSAPSLPLGGDRVGPKSFLLGPTMRAEKPSMTQNQINAALPRQEEKL